MTKCYVKLQFKQKFMILEIGNKPLSELTQDNLIDIIKIIGALPSLEYWNEPIVLDFNNTMFSDTIVIDYESYRISDNKKSCKYVFFLNYKNFSWHYSRDFEVNRSNQRNHSRNMSIKEYQYLLKKGFDVPFYNFAF